MKTELFRKVLPAALAVLALLAGARTAPAQDNLPLDEKARYERSLELKVGEVLLKLLGPNQAKVVVSASMDFTRTEKVDMTTSKAAPRGGKEGSFKWDGASEENQMSAEYLLPGFPNMDAAGKPGGGTYQKQISYPHSFIKSLSVTVVLNKDLPDSAAQSVRSVVTEILSMDPARGDALVIIKTPFAPFWRTIWYTPEAMNMVLKYLLLSFMGIMALIVVAIGFLKLAGAMNTMAKAQQSHQITMDFGKDGGPGGPGAPGLGLPADRPDFLAGPKREKETSEEAPAGQVVFNVRLDQLGFLVNLMASEDPANVALVAIHLAPEVRNKFLSLLPAETASEVISHMAKVRFVDPDVIATIKDELERRLSGALGGLQQVVDVLTKVDLRAKRQMLQKLFEKDPDTARQVRRKVFLPEDLDLLPDRDMSLVISNFKVETLSAAAWDFPQALKDKVRAQMAEKAWKMVEQTMKYGAPSREASERAVEEIVNHVMKLINEGRISNPLESDRAMLSGPQPAAGKD
jgi:hypothetical protein